MFISSEYLLDELSDKNKTVQNEILERISDYCGKPVTLPTQNDTPYTWTFYHAFFFAFTVCSTVGYGNISPTTFAGRMIMIAYSVIGIPVNGILFAGLGEYFGRTVSGQYILLVVFQFEVICALEEDQFTFKDPLIM